MPQDNYRYYRLDGTGQLHGAEWFEAANDEDAVAHVKAKEPDAKWELWREHRLVATSYPHTASNILAASLRTLADARRTLSDTAHLVERPTRLGRADDAR